MVTHEATLCKRIIDNGDKKYFSYLLWVRYRVHAECMVPKPMYLAQSINV